MCLPSSSSAEGAGADCERRAVGAGILDDLLGDEQIFSSLLYVCKAAQAGDDSVRAEIGFRFSSGRRSADRHLDSC